MVILEKYISKDAYVKLQKENIDCWQDLFMVHKNRREEFWNDFSKAIKEIDRKKLEKVLYRECVWDNDKYYYHYQNNILKDKSFIERQDIDGIGFEIVKFEIITTNSDLLRPHNPDNLYKSKLEIDRINRTITHEEEYTTNDVISTTMNIDYYTLNKIFQYLRSDLVQDKFECGMLQTSRYNTYKLTNSNGESRVYNLWISSTKSRIQDILLDILDGNISKLKTTIKSF